ncbi:hypothetical protein PRZ48_005220 [Zasmidium cellare]|uniref:Uncharacterized protein n=1 Tax=Zasmidium cellare TaxID=395010 RepID=A0ABR0ERR6_ZASCE|nr:hypothetical protein PRZ48_005220 [Zasmidium cellare]
MADPSQVELQLAAEVARLQDQVAGLTFLVAAQGDKMREQQKEIAVQQDVLVKLAAEWDRKEAVIRSEQSQKRAAWDQIAALHAEGDRLAAQLRQ